MDEVVEEEGGVWGGVLAVVEGVLIGEEGSSRMEELSVSSAIFDDGCAICSSPFETDYLAL